MKTVAASLPTPDPSGSATGAKWTPRWPSHEAVGLRSWHCRHGCGQRQIGQQPISVIPPLKCLSE